MEFNSVCFVAARQVLLRTGLEIGLVPAAAAQAEARHGQHLLELGCLAGRAIDQRRCADLLDGFQLMSTGSTLIVVHGHGDVSAVDRYCAAPALDREQREKAPAAAKRGIISGKSRQRSRLSARGRPTSTADQPRGLPITQGLARQHGPLTDEPHTLP